MFYFFRQASDIQFHPCWPHTCPFVPGCTQTSHLLVSAFQGLGMQAEVAKCLIFLYSGLGGVPQSRDWGGCAVSALPVCMVHPVNPHLPL